MSDDNIIKFDEAKQKRDAKKAAKKQPVELVEASLDDLPEELREALNRVMRRIMGEEESPGRALRTVLEGLSDGTLDAIEVLKAAPYSATVVAACFVNKNHNADRDAYYGGREYNIKRKMVTEHIEINDDKIMIARDELPTMEDVYTAALEGHEVGAADAELQEFGIKVAGMLDEQLARIADKSGGMVNLSTHADMVAAHAKLLRSLHHISDPEVDSDDYGNKPAGNKPGTAA